MARSFALLLSHLGIACLAFLAGLYTLPILMAPASPDVETETVLESRATYSGEFRRELADSDFLHWGEGNVYLSTENIVFKGKLAPGPAYRLYLSPEFVETESAFQALKSRMALVGEVNTFENFVLAVPGDLDISRFNSVIIWCESFDQFITAAQYQ